ncbi:hypothetical protein N510_000473 [Firmicutes bacterium ASF500]|nr:hypothetical protein N510_000473 [Firmicutes bacterium ASF500]
MNEKLTSLEQLRMTAERSKALSAQVAAAAADAIEEASIPAGVVVMWSGAQSNIPAGWALCDGMNGTPDLRDRFVLGAGGRYSVGARGGADKVALSSNELPAHTHGYTPSKLIWSPSTTYGEYELSIRYANGEEYGNAFYNSSYRSDTEPAGAGSAHENMPPYYALCYIMKL